MDARRRLTLALGSCPRRRSPPLVMVMAWVLAAATHASSQQCSLEKQVSFTLNFSTNSTGHPQLNAHLEQPAESSTWRVDVEVATKRCASSNTSLKVLAFGLNGSPFKIDQTETAPPPGYKALPGLRGFFRRPEQATTWMEARAICVADGAIMMMPASQHELDVLRTSLPFNVSSSNDKHCLWLPLTDQTHEGTFVTPTGASLSNVSSLPWCSGQPSGGTRENCVVYCVTNCMHDVPCTNAYAFICQVK